MVPLAVNESKPNASGSAGYRPSSKRRCSTDENYRYSNHDIPTGDLYSGKNEDAAFLFLLNFAESFTLDTHDHTRV